MTYYLKEDKTEESIETIEESLSSADYFLHPFCSGKLAGAVEVYTSIFNNKTRLETIEESNTTTKKRIPDNMPIEEVKRRQAQEQGKPYRVPEWWGGERKAAKVAKSMMGTLPTKIGPIKK